MALFLMTFTSSLKIIAAGVFFLYEPHITVKVIILKLYYESDIGKVGRVAELV